MGYLGLGYLIKPNEKNCTVVQKGEHPEKEIHKKMAKYRLEEFFSYLCIHYLIY